MDVKVVQPRQHCSPTVNVVPNGEGSERRDGFGLRSFGSERGGKEKKKRWEKGGKRSVDGRGRRNKKGHRKREPRRINRGRISREKLGAQ